MSNSRRGKCSAALAHAGISYFAFDSSDAGTPSPACLSTYLVMRKPAKRRPYYGRLLFTNICRGKRRRIFLGGVRTPAFSLSDWQKKQKNLEKGAFWKRCSRRSSGSGSLFLCPQLVATGDCLHPCSDAE